MFSHLSPVIECKYSLFRAAIVLLNPEKMMVRLVNHLSSVGTGEENRKAHSNVHIWNTSRIFGAFFAL